MMQEDYNEQQYQFNQQKATQRLLLALNLLAKVSPASNQVKQSNRIIIDYLKQPATLKILLTLLIQAEGNDTTCSLIVSFISYYLRAQVRPGVGIVRHDKKEIYNKIKNVFFCTTVSQKHKKMLQASFSQFLATLSHEFIKLRKNLCEEIVGYFLESQQISSSDLANSLYLIEAVLTPNLESESLKFLQENLLTNFHKLSLQLMRQVSLILPSAVETKKLLPAQNQKLQWALKVHKVASLLFIKANIDKVYTLKSTLIISPNLANLCQISLHLSPDGNSFMLNENQLEGFNLVNEIKLETLKIMEDYLTMLVKGRKNLSDAKYVPVQETIRAFLKVLNPLACQVQSYPQQPIPSKQLFQKSLIVLAKVVQIPLFLNELTSLRDLVMFRICFPCLIPTPEDTNLAAEDYCDKREKLINFTQPSNVHQAASNLIQSYANEIYGTVPYLTRSVTNLIEFQLTADPRYFDNIPNLLVQSTLYTKYNYFQQIQVCLSLLALLSYHADHREDMSAEVEALLVRRQEFFSRIDVPPHLIVGFLHFCSYYLQNFYELILSGKANARFHRSLLFHAMELLKATFNFGTRDYSNNEMKKIGIQAIDYISNALIQPKLFSAIFPQWDQQAPHELVKLIDSLCLYFDSTANISVIETVLIDFVTRCIDRHYKEQNRYANMPKILKNQISLLLPEKIMQNFKPSIKNDTIARQKMMELYSLLLVFCDEPTSVMQKGVELINYITENEYAFIDEALDVIQVYLKRVVQQKLKMTPILESTISKCVLKCLKICDNQKYQSQVFDVVLNLNLLCMNQQEITNCLLQNFREQLEEKDTDAEAEMLMEKTLYLLIQIAFSNYNAVSGMAWTNVIENMVEYMRICYQRQDTVTIGKATCVLLSCYAHNPDGVENLMGDRIEGLWDCILDDHLKYSSQTEKKIACITLLNFMIHYSSRPRIKDKFPFLLKSVCIIMYYIYEKSQITWGDEQSEEDDEDKSSVQQEQKKPWKQVYSTMRQNKFLSDLPDEKAMLKNLCIKLYENDRKNFEKFINDLPIGIQNLVKNKIMMYREDTSLVNKKKIRAIYKVKKLQQDA